MTDNNLLMGSQSLTDEEEKLREELSEWCREKFRQGARPIPLQAAVLIVSDLLRDPDGNGFRE
ncbi:hypothetical protein [Roseovarius pacificus]|uniref:hypothetical protein n=1 Tax=Roseovarius pacificus TaxID=337701 RepID=UPI00403A4523